MMLGEESAPAAFWKQVGDESLRRGVKSIVMMGAHWECLGNKVQVSMNPAPQKTPVAYVRKERYANFKIVPDLEMGERVLNMLQGNGIEAEPADTFDYIHDTFLVLVRMYAERGASLPVVVISTNARFDPNFHARIGMAVRPLRYEDVLIIGSGGAVHNLYRNHWMQMVLYRDNFAMPKPPDDCMLEFRQAVEDAFTMHCGPALRRAITRLMKHPRYREAHGTDEHFIPACFAAGAAGGNEDKGSINTMTAECWELVNMANTQFQLGTWD